MNDVIAWLWSPEGLRWAHHRKNPLTPGPAEFQPRENTVAGFFTIKEDPVDRIGIPYTGDLYWGELPGDDKLAKEAGSW
jgi:hypothetical protein